MSLNQTVRSLIDKLPTLTSEERWVVHAVLDMADQRTLLLEKAESPPAPAARPVERRPRSEPVYYAALCAAPYYVTTRELEVLDLLLSGLSNKEVGVVVGQHRGLPGRPVVRVVKKDDEEMTVKEFDLAKHTTLFIEAVLA